MIKFIRSEAQLIAAKQTLEWQTEAKIVNRFVQSKVSYAMHSKANQTAAKP